MSDKDKDDSDTSESEVSASSSNFDPLKALYSSRTIVPIQNAPLYENLQQFESAMAGKNVVPVGDRNLVKRREEAKKQSKLIEQKELEEKNKQRFSQFQGLTRVVRQERKAKNVLTRIESLEGPLAALKDCVDRSIRIKVVTRNATGIRGELYATLLAFDKQWNLALSDVLEVWRRKAINKRKIPPAMGVPVARGTAAARFSVPAVTESPLGHGLWECTRFMPQLLVRGEHVVYINVVERWATGSTVANQKPSTSSEPPKL